MGGFYLFLKLVIMIRILTTGNIVVSLVVPVINLTLADFFNIVPGGNHEELCLNRTFLM